MGDEESVVGAYQEKRSNKGKVIVKIEDLAFFIDKFLEI